MDRPILFSSPMVRAIIDGRKTMTRRVYKPRFDKWEVGDRLWVRETYVEYCPEKTEGMEDWDYDNPQVAYRATEPDFFKDCFDAESRREYDEEGKVSRWRPSIFMPRKLSRILLEITELKRERIRDCSNEDAIREGFLRNIEFWEYFWKMNAKLYPQGVDEMVLMINPVVLAIGFKVLEVKK